MVQVTTGIIWKLVPMIIWQELTYEDDMDTIDLVILIVFLVKTHTLPAYYIREHFVHRCN